MLETLRTPLRAFQLLLVSLAALAGVTLYCLAYTWFSGHYESPAEAIAWAIANVLPWLAAFEAGKRSRRIRGKALALGVALIVSLGLGLLIEESGSLGFELVRRLPGLLVTAAVLAAANFPRKGSTSVAADPKDLPLAPEQIDWVAAAGNYVELHGCGRTFVHRAPLSSVQAQLSRRGFIRIHRSTLVRRDRIARVRPVDIILHDGTSLRVGKRYRALLHADNFVPSSHRSGSPDPVQS